MPPLMLRPGFGFVWRLIMLTPSTTSRFFAGSTFRMRPRLPRSLPVMTSTLSFFRSGLCNKDIENLLKYFRRQRNNLHEAALAQLARHRSEDTGPDRLILVVNQHRGIPVEADVAAVAAALLFHRAHDHSLDDLPLFHRAVGNR